MDYVRRLKAIAIFIGSHGILCVLMLQSLTGCSLYQKSMAIVQGDNMTTDELSNHGVSMSPIQGLARGIQFEDSGKLYLAEEEYLKVLEEGSHAEEALFNLGNVYAARGEKFFRRTKWREKALGSYKKALELNSDNAAAMNNMADVLIKEKQFDEAFTYLSEIAKPGVPDFEYYLSTLGDAHKGLRQYEKALGAYSLAEKEAVKEAMPDEAFLSALYMNIGDTYVELGEERKVGE